MNKDLVCYFSTRGTTKKAATIIRNALGADIFEIVPAKPYTDEDLDWTDKNSRTSVECKDKEFRAEIRDNVAHMGAYNRVFIGFPIWWYVAPSIINTFIEANDFTNKEVYVFVTSGSSGADEALRELKKTYPNINFVKAKRFKNTENDEDVKNWLN